VVSESLPSVFVILGHLVLGVGQEFVIVSLLVVEFLL
jgi:hypothetical protein